MSTRSWNPRKMFDVSEAEKRAIEERAQMRQKLRMEWQKKVSDPHRGAGGAIFDPAVQRFISMRANHWEQFKVTPKSTYYGLGFTVLPIFFFWYMMEKDRRERDEKCRAGKIAYKDRDYKFI